MVTIKAPRKTTASVVALAVLIATPVGIAVAHPGFPTADVDLYQRAVWVTNENLGLAGLVNRQIRELTASVPVSKNLDVLQWADTVIAHDRLNDTAGLIDAAVQRIPAQVKIPPGSVLGLGGSTLSVLDPVGGLLWTLPAESGLEGELDPQQAVEVGQRALAVVSTDGTVFVASREQSQLLKLNGPGAPAQRIGDLPEGELLAVTAIGERFVVATASGTGTLVTVVDGGSIELPDGVVRLQQPGHAAEHVVVATSGSLLRVPLGGGEPVVMHSTRGAPALDPEPVAAPVVVGAQSDACVYAAWASAAEFVRSCDGRDVEVRELAASAGELVFRVNRDSVVLNNVKTGDIYLVQDDMTVIAAADWLAVAPPLEEIEASESDESTTQQEFDEVWKDRSETNTRPEPENDEFGIRFGPTTVLRVLENDVDPDGDVLTISSVTGLSPDVATLDIIDGGRALQITPVSSASGQRTIGYTVTDGREDGTAQAVATVNLVAEGSNDLPEAQRISQLSLEAGGTISYNVLADWRDPDGDDLYLTSAASTAGDLVRFSPDGLVTLSHSGTEPGERTLVFTVSDGRVEAAAEPAGELRVSIKPGGTLPPLTVPDFGQAFVGQAVVINPLENDVARSARDIGLFNIEAITDGVSFSAVPDSDGYRFSAAAPGSYYVTYVAGSGAGLESLGILRLDVIDDPDAPLPPIAVKDTAYLRPGEPLTVPVLLNDVSPDGAVLGIQSIDVPEQEAARGLTVEVLGGAYLRIASTGPLLAPVSVAYTISDGVSSSSSNVTIVPIPELVSHQSPIARDDRVTVRVGDTANVDVLANDLHPDGVIMRLNPELVQGFEEVDGVAFTQGARVRIQAPSEAGTFALVYRVDDDFNEYATGRILVTVTPETESESNSSPLPATLTARVQAGGSVPIEIPTSGVDIDGDSVMVMSASGGVLGRVTSVGPSGFTYEAGRGPGGTDVIQYTVQDSFGAQGKGEVRIGVIPPPAVPLPPVAVDDVAEVRPGDTAIVRVLDNDSDPANAQISLNPELIEVDAGVDASVIDDGLVAITAGEIEDTFVVRYGIANSQGGESDAFIKVSVTPDARPQPPIADDVVLTVPDVLGLDRIDVSLLEGAVNPDGRVEDLEVAIVGASESSVVALEAGVATIEVRERRQTVSFTVTSPETDLLATAFVVVPGAVSELRPSLKPEFETSPITVAIGESKTFAIRDLVDVPSGGDLVIIDGRSTSGATQADEEGVDLAPVAATGGLELITALSSTELRISPTEVPPGGSQSITVLVTDGITDVDGGTPITIPVIIGDPESRDVAPVFTPFVLEVEDLADEVSRDLRASVSHPNPAIVDDLEFGWVASGSTGSVRVSVTGGVITAQVVDSSATPGDEVLVDLEIQSDQLLTTEPVIAQVTVRVVPSTRPLAQAVDDVEADARPSSTYTISPLDNDFNPFASRGDELRILGVEFEGGSLGAPPPTIEGSTVVIATGPTKSGTITLVYTVGDATGDEGREVQGRITIVVTSAPEWTPAGVAFDLVQRSGSQSLTVRFAPPVWNGSPEAAPPFIVRAFNASSGAVAATRADCVAGLPCVFSGLSNGTPHYFVVTAENAVGPTSSVPSATETPYGTPSTPGAPSLSADGYAPTTLRASWSVATDTGGGSVRYQWKYVGAADPAQAFSGFTSTSNQTIASSAGVGSYRIQVRACNAANLCGPWSAQSNQVSVINQPTWQVQVDAASSCAQRSGGAAGLPGCAGPSNIWIPANTTLTVSCYVSWNLNVLGSNPSVWYYISSGSYSSYYVAQRTLGPSWDSPGYVIPGMPSC